MPLRIGDSIGHYRITGVLGRGGMGEVFRAIDTRLNRSVAIKLLSNELADAEERRRFQRESQTASSLNHPHIVTVFDVGDISGRQYIVTEYVDGGTLKDWARREPRDWRQVVELLNGIADALATAHQAHVLHRDVKPANILVTGSGYAKLGDFGLAKLAPQASIGDAATGTGDTLTAPGIVMGTIAYMSPEQASGLPLDLRSDIFSFGVVLYELLAGRHPFRGKSDLEVLHKVIQAEAPPLADAIPAALRGIVEKALAKDPAQRYQSMRAVVEDLRRAVRSTAADRTPTRLGGLTWLALVAAVGLVGVLLWARWPSEIAAPLRAMPFTTFPGVERYPSFSPDGDRVAFSWTGELQDNTDIYVQQVGAGTPLRLTTDPAADYNPGWSPDGRWIAFLRGSPPLTSGIIVGDELRLIPPLGGPERKLADIRVGQTVSRPAFLTWCPDSSCVVVTDSPADSEPDRLIVVSLETGEKRPLTRLDGPAYGDTNPAIAPDGQSIVFRRNLAFGAGELYWLRLKPGIVPDGEPRRLTAAALDAAYPVWSPLGDHVLFSARDALWKLSLPGGMPGESAPQRLPFIGEDGLMPAVSRAGAGGSSRLVYARSFRDANVWRIETAGHGEPATRGPIVTIASTRLDQQARFSPDGKRVAFQSDRSGAEEIWVANADGTDAVPLTSMGAAITAHANWSPDGQSIVFDSNLEGQFDLYLIPAGGGRPRRLTDHAASDHYPSFSRDGQWIYFASNRSRAYQVWKMPASGGDAVPFTTQGGWVAIESFDGTSVYYTETTGTIPTSLWRLPAAGDGPPVKIVDGVIQRAFDVDATGLYYIDKSVGSSRLAFLDFATGQSRTVAANLGEVGPSLSASPGGRTILYTRQDSNVDDLMLVEDFR